MRLSWRPTLVVGLLSALALGTTLLALRPIRGEGGRPAPLPLAEGDREVAFIASATSTSSWERFVAAVRRVAERFPADRGGVACSVVPSTAFPAHTTAVPEVAIQPPGQEGWLRFRWYKQTSTWKIRDWVAALLARSRPPLAFLGGSSSDGARELAQAIADQTEDGGERPLLFLIQATAVRLHDRGSNTATPLDLPVPMPLMEPCPEETACRALLDIYPRRTFRFCFTNAQMAAAVTRFVWTQDELRPDADPVQVVRWDDDVYSYDLVDGFLEALGQQALEAELAERAWVLGLQATAGTVPAAGGPFPVASAGILGSSFRMAVPLPRQYIASSVGTFHSPNRFEEETAGYLLESLARYPTQQRPLLVVTGQASPSRRFLRTLARQAPLLARRFVVVTGDALSFNTVYRDGSITWPVQELPFPLVFFCHHNPIDPGAGFRALDEDTREQDRAQATGTEDVLLYGDIVEALFRSAPGPTWPDADRLADRLRELRVVDQHLITEPAGVSYFLESGDRRGGTGEYIVYLRPDAPGERTRARATVEVWAFRARPDGDRYWQRVGPPLPVPSRLLRFEGRLP